MILDLEDGLRSSNWIIIRRCLARPSEVRDYLTSSTSSFISQLRSTSTVGVYTITVQVPNRGNSAHTTGNQTDGVGRSAKLAREVISRRLCTCTASWRRRLLRLPAAPPLERLVCAILHSVNIIVSFWPRWRPAASCAEEWCRRYSALLELEGLRDWLSRKNLEIVTDSSPRGYLCVPTRHGEKGHGIISGLLPYS